jgi:hypothetical protein
MVRMKPYVERACVVDKKDCTLKSKCDECLKEIDDLLEMEIMFEKTMDAIIKEYIELKAKEILSKRK